METTKWTLTVATFHILDNPLVEARLKAELAEAMPDADVILQWEELENLPYLSAVISESEFVSKMTLYSINHSQACDFHTGKCNAAHESTVSSRGNMATG